MDSIDPQLTAWGLFVSSFISSTLAPGGSEAVLAYLVSQTEMDPVWLLLIATIGNTLGAITTFALGILVALGYPLQRFRSDRYRKAINAVRKWGLPILFLSWMPVVGDAFCMAAGWLRMPFWKSLAVIAAGKALRYAVVIYAFK